MNWLKIIVAAVFEVVWVIGLTHSTNIVEWLTTLIAIFLSFYLLIQASKVLPVGTTYAIFVGLGTTGVTLSDFFIFGQTIYIEKIVLIFILLAGVVGLKLATSNEKGV